MRYKIIKMGSIESTSVWARKNLSSLNDIDVISADIQSSGHGQFERKWLSSDKNGGNAYLSIVLKPEKLEHLNELTRFTAQIVSETLVEYGLKPDFKFPNDVLIDGKKISGILAESVFLGSEFKGVVVGIGINLNLEPDEINKIDIPATSIFNETGKTVDKSEFLNRFLNNFTTRYDNFLDVGIEELSYIDKPYVLNN